jgi:hypothetical protein
MRTTFIYFIISLITLAIMQQCTSAKKNPNTATFKPEVNTEMHEPVFRPGPQIILYKTRADYSNLVAVTLNEDGTSISSYPAPQDFKDMQNQGKPVKLENGYLWDQRGIGPKTAFLTITVDEYSKLTKVHSIEKMLGMIKDAKPFTEMWDCGVKTSKTTEAALNSFIINGMLPKKAKPLISSSKK